MNLKQVNGVGSLEVFDEKGNSLYYSVEGNYYKPLVAQYNGVMYTKEELRWKRTKSGAVSTEFYNWLETVDNQVRG